MNRKSIRNRLSNVLFQVLTLAAGSSLFQNGCGGGGFTTDGYYGYGGYDSSYSSSVMDWSNYGWGSLMRDEDYLGYGDWVDSGSPISNDW